MERLSEKLLEILNEQDFCFTQDEMRVVEKALYRFRDYEDTGLEPEICANYKQFEDEAISKGVPFSRIVELMEADQASRLVLLPCKVGDTVFFIGYGMVEELKVYFVSLNVDESGSNATLFLRRLDGTTEQVDNEDFENMVFFNKEKAEEALKGGKENA